MPEPSATPLPFNLLRAMDAVCDAFDGAWDGGQRPEIDRFLPQVEEAVRPLLLEELVRAELEWRCRRGEQPSTGEYAGRYPGCRDKLDNWLAEARAGTQTWNQATATFSPAPTPEPFVVPATSRPAILGEYELLMLLGEGGMGEVWMARHRRLDKLVALKRLSGKRLRDAGARARFLQEMRAMGRLEHHPNLIKVDYAGEHEGTDYLVMELVQGQDLARLLHERGSLPVSQACELMQQTALGLQHLHKHGLVHRDLKPSNLIRTPDGTVKILDFGLARLRLDGPADDLTSDGQVMGTPDYVAPEQIGGAARVDIRADLYSLGATLFHLLAGRAPFADREGFWPKLDAHRHEPPPDLRRLRPEVPAALAELVARLLAKKPEDRPQTPAEVAAALALFTTTTPTPPTPPPPAENGWRRRLLLAAGCAALAAILVGVIGVYHGLPRQAGKGKPPPPAGASLARQAEGLLKEYCYRCHGQDGRNEGGFNYILSVPQLIARKKIVPGDAEGSKLIKKIKSGDMPPRDDDGKPIPQVSDEDAATLEKWIAAGAPDFSPPVAERDFSTPEEMFRKIRDDLEKANERDRRFLRYFTLTHLYNAGLSEDELQSYRHGLSKLVNSLSWGRKIVAPQPVAGTAGTVLRIDLRDYKWSEKIWDQIQAANPYGIISDSAAAKGCSQMTQAKLPHVRGDWFVFAAARPPLYHDVLQLPKTDRELEKLLQVDVAEDIRQERVARAGFNGSGVSQNNRLIERHDLDLTRGAFWKSHDFAKNTERKNLFEHPLGPDEGKNSFEHDGGEIIFNLPNGLQAYMLVNARGDRIDKGPTTIVTDKEAVKKGLGPEVINGISCMSCHARGMIEKDDQIREYVEKNPNAFSKEEADTILVLYPGKKKLAEWFRQDAERFAAAVKKTGAQLSRTEPIVALSVRFEQELDLKLAAAEVGITEEDLRKALDGDKDLARAVGELKVGTMKRDKFEAAFGLIVNKFPEVGGFVPIPGRQERTDPTRASPLKPGDRVSLVERVDGCEDEDPSQNKHFRVVPKGTKGEVIKIDKERDDLCQIRLDKPAGVEVWVPIKKVTKE
jgi:serine/threonine protein kinase/succinate dehydrogenase flavin-adding protein (antitoxin of CptAB toxin-antitoxin module)